MKLVVTDDQVKWRQKSNGMFEKKERGSDWEDVEVDDLPKEVKRAFGLPLRSTAHTVRQRTGMK